MQQRAKITTKFRKETALLWESNLLLHVCLHLPATKNKENNCSLFSPPLLRESNVLLHVCLHPPAKRAKGTTKFREHVRSFKRETVPSSSSVNYASSLLAREHCSSKGTTTFQKDHTVLLRGL
jgi:hypothetical protein